MAVGDYTLKPFTLPAMLSPALPMQVRNNDNIIRQKFNAHQSDTVAHIQSGLIASRPASPAVGTTYISTDIGSETVSIYTAAGWVTVSGGGGGGGSLSGGGTANTIAMWTGAAALGNSVMTQSGTTVTVTGSLTVTGTLTGTLTGNASTVTNGVYTSGSYANPSWITSLAASKLTGVVGVANGGTGISTYPTTGDTERIIAYDRVAGTYTTIASGASRKFLTTSGGALAWDFLPVFTTTQDGAVPTPGSALGTTYYLNAAGSWTVPTVTSIAASGVTGGTISVPGPGTFSGAFYKFLNDLEVVGTLTASLPWTSITGKPSYFPADVSNASGTLVVARGGTGQTTYPTTGDNERIVAYDRTAGTYTTITSGASRKFLTTAGGALAWDFLPVFNTTQDGAVPTPGSALGTTYYLNAAGTWTVPTVTSIAASGVTGGTIAVPGPGTFSGSYYKFLNDLEVVGTLTGTLTGSITGNAATVTNGVYTTGSYSNPSWITALAGSKISGNISGNAANVTGIVAVANGGTNQATWPTTGDTERLVVYDRVANQFDVAPNGSSGQFLTVTSGAPTWATPPNFSTSTTTAGYVPGSNGVGATYFLNANGAWSIPTISSISAASVTAGTFPGALYTFTDSAKVNGDFTVDTNTLFVDSTNNRVGIGTVTPSYQFDATGIVRTQSQFLANGTVAAGTYSVDALAASGAARDILRAGVSGVTNGFTVQYTGSAMSYRFIGGQMTVGDNTSGVSTLSVNRTSLASIPALGTQTGNQFAVLGDNAAYGLLVGVLSTGSVFQQATYTNGTATAFSILLNPLGGDVGIGTQTPNDRLEVSGNIRTSPGANRYLQLGSASNYYYRLQAVGDDLHFIEAASTVRMAIKYPNGYVGIGTTSPDAVLHTVGGTAMTSSWNRTALLEATYPVLGFKSTAGSKWAGIGYDSGSGMRVWVNASTNDISAGTVAMTVDTSGNLSMGSGKTVTAYDFILS